MLIQQVWPPKTSDGMLNIHLFSITAYPELRVMSTNVSCLKERLHSQRFFYARSVTTAFIRNDANEKASPMATICSFVIKRVVEECGGGGSLLSDL